jgi:hypothetical protein
LKVQNTKNIEFERESQKLSDGENWTPYKETSPTSIRLIESTARCWKAGAMSSKLSIPSLSSCGGK